MVASDQRRQEFIDRRVETADQFALWAKKKSLESDVPQVAANGVIVLIKVACALLDRQLAAQAEAFQNEGGFKERLYRTRTAARQQK